MRPKAEERLACPTALPQRFRHSEQPEIWTEGNRRLKRLVEDSATPVSAGMSFYLFIWCGLRWLGLSSGLGWQSAH